ncbi:MAG: hypothetical protein JJU29_02015 [Verrucomicrobia bacterium]|nr:hypothetical protein [Verrucomicrobiota bacterium]
MNTQSIHSISNRMKPIKAHRASEHKPPEDQHPGKAGKIGWALLWLMGIPIPVLLVFFLLRGCS